MKAKIAQFRRSVAWQRAKRCALLVVIVATGLLTTCSNSVSRLDQVQALGVLHVATVNRATTYYQNADNQTDGFDYLLAEAFAEQLGVAINWLVLPTEQDVLDAVESGTADFAAAGLAIADGLRTRFQTSPPLRSVTPQVIYRRGNRRPRSIDEPGQRIRVLADSAVETRLRKLAADSAAPPTIVPVPETDDEALSFEVGTGTHPLAAVRSDIVAINRRYYPKLAVAYNLGSPMPIAWVFPRQRDASIYNRAIAFIEDYRASTELARIHDRFFGQLGRLDYVGSRKFSRDVERKLDRWRPSFEKAAKQTGLDWRLLAAVGYQESHWNPDAKSPTGVRGLMMLTRDTARYLRVKNRRDPEQSIAGGSRYLREQIDRLPAEIPEPDRTWMALAAYNLGLGHLLDARTITEQNGGDPNRWVDVRSNLPLLAQAQWHRQTRHGYARGHEAVTYVGNIRTYFDVLAWVTDGETDAMPRSEPAVPPPELPPPVNDEEDNPLDIDSPIF